MLRLVHSDQEQQLRGPSPHLGNSQASSSSDEQNQPSDHGTSTKKLRRLQQIADSEGDEMSLPLTPSDLQQTIRSQSSHLGSEKQASSSGDEQSQPADSTPTKEMPRLQQIVGTSENELARPAQEQEIRRQSSDLGDSQASSSGDEQSQPADSTSFSPAPLRATRTYAVKLKELNQEMLAFLKTVRNFFTRSTNLERQTAPLKNTTYLKAQERMLCKSQ